MQDRQAEKRDLGEGRSIILTVDQERVREGAKKCVGEISRGR